MAEPRQLEQSRQPIHRAAGQRQPFEGLAHELVRRLPGRARHPRARREALEASVALDDRHARGGLAGEILQAFVHRFGQRPGLRGIARALPPPGEALGEEQQHGQGQRGEARQQRQSPQ